MVLGQAAYWQHLTEDLKTKAEAVLGDASLGVLVVVAVDLSAVVPWDLI